MAGWTRAVSITILAAAMGCRHAAETPAGPAPVRLAADGPGDTYELIEGVLGRGTIEAPDKFHPDFGRHVAEEWDGELGRNVFAFYLHLDSDGDPAGDSKRDRQRNEIKIFDGSRDGLKGYDGMTFVYEWKFRLGPALRVTHMWTHFFQLKPVGGPDDGMPIITISAADKRPGRKIEVRYCSGAPGGNKYEYVASNDLNQALGVWLAARCRVTYGEKGAIEMTLRKPDGTPVLSYKAENLSLWRERCKFVRPKWGIYRGLAEGLRDEKVLFTDFAITKE